MATGPYDAELYYKAALVLINFGGEDNFSLAVTT